VLFWQAMGSRPEGGKLPAEYFVWLGIAEPPEKGDYLISLYKFAAMNVPPTERNAFFDLVFQLGERPWKAKDHLRVAAWLQANEKALAKVVEGTRRPGYINPLTPHSTNGESGTFSRVTAWPASSATAARSLNG
jgi:hypothetical protein